MSARLEDGKKKGRREWKSYQSKKKRSNSQWKLPGLRQSRLSCPSIHWSTTEQLIRMIVSFKKSVLQKGGEKIIYEDHMRSSCNQFFLSYDYRGGNTYRVFKFRGVWYVLESTLWNCFTNFDSRHFFLFCCRSWMTVFRKKQTNLTVFRKNEVTSLRVISKRPSSATGCVFKSVFDFTHSMHSFLLFGIILIKYLWTFQYRYGLRIPAKVLN